MKQKQMLRKGMSVALATAVASSQVTPSLSIIYATFNEEGNTVVNALESGLNDLLEPSDTVIDEISPDLVESESDSTSEDETSVETEPNLEESDKTEDALEEQEQEDEQEETPEASLEETKNAELLINQVYGGGNKGETPFTHSFIEIYNRTDEAIELDQYTIQYSTEESAWVALQLEGMLAAKGTYLIRCNEEETSVAKYSLTDENTDLTWDQIIANKQYRMAIVNSKTVLDGFEFEEGTIVDVLGAQESGEGNTGGKISKQKSLRRIDYVDTNDNATDFKLVTYNDDSHQKSDLPPSLQSQFVEAPEVEVPDEEGPNLGEHIDDTVLVEKIAGYVAGGSNEEGGVAEIIKYNPINQKFYVINGAESTVHIVSLDELNQDSSQQLKTDKVVNLAQVVSVGGFVYGDISSLDINTKMAVIVAAVQEADYSKNGKIVVMDYEGNVLKQFEAGVQPDMVKMTKDGQYILTANEGEPRLGLVNGIDPKGSITIVDYFNGTTKNVYFDDAMIDSNVLIRNTASGATTDLEPEYIALSGNGKTAYVTLQENNAIATLDIASGTVKSIKGLGYKDHSVAGFGLDAANDGQIDIEQLPILGVYMPDGMDCITIDGVDYLVTANEGDATEWVEFEKVTKLSKVKANLSLDASLFKGMTEEEVAAKLHEIQNSKKYDSLEVLTHMPNDAIYVLGGRSFSMWRADSMELVFDSGDDFEVITAQRYPEVFNVSNSNLKKDDRSRKKGPEPEDVKVGEMNGKFYAFIGLERTGGVMMYDVTNPSDVKFANYLTTRDYTQDIGGDVAPEGLEFIPAEVSPTGYPLLLVANEVSGTVAVNQIDIQVEKKVDPIVDINIFHTNDTHARVDSNIGFAKFKRFMDLANGYVTAEGALVLDAGDTLHGTSFATLQTGESVAQVMNAVGYDAMAPGNHDFNYGQDRLTELADIANLEVLAGNVFDANMNLKYGNIYIKEIEGVKVGVFGLATPETAYKTNPNNVEGLSFGTKQEIIDETKLMVEMLKAQDVNMIIGLMHMGIDQDSDIKSTDIASAVAGIDLIIDGHSHSELCDYDEVNGTIITSTGEHFKNVGLVTVQYNKQTRQLNIQPQQISAEDLSGVVADPQVNHLINEIKDNQEDILNEIIGATSSLLDGERSSVRYGHTNLGHLLTAAMLKETNADLALTNGGGIRASIQKGNITKGDVLTVLPFGNYIVTVEMTGKQIVEALNHGLVVGTGQFTHFAGLTATVNVIKEDSKADRYEVVSATIAGKPIDLAKKYVVATNDFMAAGGDGYDSIGAGKLLNEFAALDEALISYIQTEGEAGIEKANQADVLTVISNPVTDQVAPVITLSGAVQITAMVGDKVTLPSATATDDVDGNVFVSVIVVDPQGNDVKVTESTFTASQVGDYTAVYVAQDSAGNKETRTYTIKVSVKDNNNNSNSNSTSNSTNTAITTNGTQNPETGDDFQIVAMITLMMGSLVGLAVGIKKYWMTTKIK